MITAWSADGRGTEVIQMGDPMIMPWVMKRSPNRPFTRRMDARMIKMRRTGMKWKDIAASLDRSYGSVFNRYYKIIGEM